MRGAWAITIAFVALGGCDGCRKTRAFPPPDPPIAPVASVRPSASASASAAPVASPPPAAPEHCLGPAPEEATDDAPMVRSHDGRSVAWTEREPVDVDASFNAWSVSFLCFERDGKRRVLLPTDAYDAGEPWNGFFGFVFSRDDRVLFFLTQQYAVTTGAWGVEVSTGKSFYVTDGTIVEEIDHGPYKGSLVATHYRLDEDHEIGSPGYTGRGMTSDVIDWKGKRLRKLPEDDGQAYKRIIDGK